MTDATEAALLRAPDDDLACFHTGKMTVRQLRALIVGHDETVERCERAAREAANKILGNRSHYALIGPGGVAHAMTAAIRALKGTKP